MQNSVRARRFHPAAASVWQVILVFAMGAVAGHVAAANLKTACCNVVELRQYTLHPGLRDAFTQLFDGTFAEPQDATGMTVIGEYWDLDRPDRFVWIRGFQDMEARAKELTSFYDTAVWRTYRSEANASIADSDNVLLLEPISPAGGFKDIPARPAGAAAASGRLIVVTLYYTVPEGLAGFIRFFDRSLRGRAEFAGARTVAEYATSKQPNNFPRLAVRTGESIVVWVTRFTSPEAYAAYLEKRDADPQWREKLWPVARAQLVRDPEVLRMSPTPRSRLRG